MHDRPEPALDFRRLLNPRGIAVLDRAREAFQLYAERRIPVYPTPGRAAKGAAALAAFARKQARVASRRAPSRPVAHQAFLAPGNHRTLGEHRSKALLASYGIPVVREKLLSFVNIEALAEPPLDFPLVAKLESADLRHKSEAGAVRVGITSLPELKQAAREMQAAALRCRPQAHIDGVLVQEMARGVEVTAGAVNDPYFGPTMLFGIGGILAEVLQDVTHRFAPFDHQTAREMILNLRGARPLRGYRNQPAVDLDAFAMRWCASRGSLWTTPIRFVRSTSTRSSLARLAKARSRPMLSSCSAPSRRMRRACATAGEQEREWTSL